MLWLQTYVKTMFNFTWKALLLKSIASKCIKCPITRRDLLQQQMGQLSAFRLKHPSHLFNSVSLDLFGPVKI